jgi:hypothetical protein
MSSPTPFYCDMTALTSDQRTRHSELAGLLQASLAVIRELPDGYEFEFSWRLDTYAALAEITPLEHACCPVFDIGIRIESESNKLCWRLTGREGIKPFIRAEFGAWFGRSALLILVHVASSND